jgi:hypothetical protein
VRQAAGGRDLARRRLQHPRARARCPLPRGLRRARPGGRLHLRLFGGDRALRPQEDRPHPRRPDAPHGRLRRRRPAGAADGPRGRPGADRGGRARCQQARGGARRRRRPRGRQSRSQSGGPGGQGPLGRRGRPRRSTSSAGPRPPASRSTPCARKGGTLVVVGLYGDKLVYPLPLFPLPGALGARLLRGHARGSPGGRALRQGRPVEAPARDQGAARSRSIAAMADLAAGRVTGRIVLAP